MRTHFTLEDVLELCEQASYAAKPTQEMVQVAMYIEKLFYTAHINDIRKRQDRLTKLWQDKNRFIAFWNGKDEWVNRGIRTPAMLNGCWHCLFNIVTHVRHSTKCTQNCDFCYYNGGGEQRLFTIGKGLYSFSESGNMNFTLDEAKLLVDRQLADGKMYGALGWLQREPLEELDAMEPIMTHVSRNVGIHQYLYTNGVRATEEVIDKLADWGLNEIRFNLMATNFSDEVIKRIGYAKKKIQSVAIETPIFSKSYKLFVEKRKAILETGLDQINIPELQVVSPTLLSHFMETEGPVYKHRRGYVSPISSRHYAYDLIELAEEEDWKVIINDCSNDTKYFRGASSNYQLGRVGYLSYFELPFDSIAVLADRILEEGVTYEFFQEVRDNIRN